MKYRYRILLETERDLVDFVNTISRIEGKIMVVDGDDQRVSARSVLGLMYAMTFSEIWCEADVDIYTTIQRFVV